MDTTTATRKKFPNWGVLGQLVPTVFTNDEKNMRQLKLKKKKKGEGWTDLSDEVVKGPVVVFFLADDVFEHSACFAVTTFHGFFYDFSV